MSSAVRTLFLVGIKQEEPATEEKHDKATRSVTGLVRPRLHRQCRRFLTRQASESSESDGASSGDEWHPPSSPSASSRQSSRTRNIGRTTSSVVPTEEYNSAASSCRSDAASNEGAHLETRPLEILRPKDEAEEPSVEEPLREPVDVRRLSPRHHTCSVCGGSFAQREELWDHIDSIHDKPQRYTCEICGKSVSTPGSLKRHVDHTHKKLRDYVCDTCGKPFLEKRALQRHIDGTHKKVKKYSCGKCGKPFFEVRDLNTHIDVVHKKVLPHKCDVCGKRFPRPRERKIHADAVHRKLRRHKCEFTKNHSHDPRKLQMADQTSACLVSLQSPLYSFLNPS
ncbi:hypothetical protein SprV_0100002000 [Sparganum proliferum]